MIEYDKNCQFCSYPTNQEDCICKACKGVMEPNEAEQESEVCEHCDGEGEIDLSIGPSRVVKCEECGGTGEA